jgi:hypothetical protein
MGLMGLMIWSFGRLVVWSFGRLDSRYRVGWLVGWFGRLTGGLADDCSVDWLLD